MFTGLIEEIGTIVKINKGYKSSQLTISSKKLLSDVKLGDSICTNGVCLTVTHYSSNNFTVDVMAETLRRSALNQLKIGDKINLERALKVGDRLGGHLVSGHIDGIGIISNYQEEDNATWITIKTNQHILKFIVLKGSVAIDGVSLTVAYVDNESFKVSIIPHTQDETTLINKKINDEVNLECDMIGKYVEKFINNSANSKGEEIKDQSRININYLKENGFF